MFLDDFPENRTGQINDVLQALDTIESGIASAQLPMQDLRTSIMSLPRVTKEIVKAKRRAAIAVDKLVQEFADARLLIKEIRQRFNLLKINQQALPKLKPQTTIFLDTTEPLLKPDSGLKINPE
jgi:hypothetical protein